MSTTYLKNVSKARKYREITYSELNSLTFEGIKRGSSALYSWYIAEKAIAFKPEQITVEYLIPDILINRLVKNSSHVCSRMSKVLVAEGLIELAPKVKIQ